MENLKIWNEEMPLFDKEIKNKENENAATLIPFLVEDDEDELLEEKPKTPKKRSAFIICGGGFYEKCETQIAEKFARWLNFYGIHAFVLNYRILPYKHPASLLDAKRAIRYIRYNAEKLNINPEKIGIMGFSSGGHLAGLVSTFFDQFEHEKQDEIDKLSARPDLTVLCYPAISLCENYANKDISKNLINNDKDLLNTLSLEKNAHDNMPQTFIWHTVKDSIVSVQNTLQYCTALKEKNVDFELHIFNYGEHGLDFAQVIDGTNQWSELLKTLLKREHFVEKQSYRWL